MRLFADSISCKNSKTSCMSNKNHRFFPENRVHPNLSSSTDHPGLSGHQIVPGVFSLGPRGMETYRHYFVVTDDLNLCMYS